MVIDEEEEHGTEVSSEKDEKHAGSLSVTCLGVTNPSDSALLAVSRSSLLVWSYCSNLGLFTEQKKNKDPKLIMYKKEAGGYQGYD